MRTTFLLVFSLLCFGLLTSAQAPRKLGSDSKQEDPVPPKEALKTFKTPDDLQLDLALSEPEISQPVFLNFDERGRMWVVQYLQYPFPAGIKRLSHDRYWRVVYDRVPPPPPKHFRGRDKITIHEDTDGDGKYDKHKTFVEGLNITTSVERGRGGVWVLNPPYLLFYPDRNGDDVPDGDPEVHLEGFGMQDTHSVVNSLRWGPDGWLYAAQGSTVNGKVKRYGTKDEPVSSMGQLIWRYHPEKRKYEIFAEGGGNAFGVELDEKGRIYSGHNGGDTRGFHYVQGGYYRKGFDKHGPLSNPFAFGYFLPMAHPKVKRFTHNFVRYEGGAFPKKYNHEIFGVDPIQRRVVLSKVYRDRSSFGSKDVEDVISSTDGWFRPVDLKLGPDGALYLADFYDKYIAHLQHHDERIDRDRGRIYRLRAKGAKFTKPINLAALPTPKLVEQLEDKNRWVRQHALRVLGDRKDKSALPILHTMLESGSPQSALEALWAINLSGGFDEAFALKALDHKDEHVRLWTVRLLGDAGEVSTAMAARLAKMAREETSVEARSQLACTARRLSAKQGLPIVRELLARSEDKKDIHIPLLLWWAIEAKAESDRDDVVALFESPKVWDLPLVKEEILERVMRRYAQAGQRKDLLVCAKLLELAPSEAHAKTLLSGFETAFSGRSLAHLPRELVDALAKRGGGSLALQVRQGKADAVAKALRLVADAKTKKEERLQLIQVLGEVRQAQAIAVLLAIVADSKDDDVLLAALGALQAHKDERIAKGVLARLNTMSENARAVAETMLASRPSWAKLLLAEVEADRVQADSIAMPIVRKMLLHRDKAIGEQIRKHWGDIQGATTEEMRRQVDRWSAVIREGTGNPAEGKKLFGTTCGKCHQLYGDGGYIGPDLTSYKREDIDLLLLHVVNPSAEIREGFESYFVATEDGRALTGFLLDKDNQVVVLRGADGQNIVIARDDIAAMNVLPQSLMPDGLLQAMKEQQVRDLFSYLRGGQPLRN